MKLTAKQLAPYTGYFLSSRREDSTIFRLVGLQPKEITATKDGNLTISTAKDFYGHPIDFHPVGNDSFYDELDQNTIHFERDAHGHVIGYATPSHSDRAPLLAAGQWLNVPLAIALAHHAVARDRSSRSHMETPIFLHKRAKLAPQPGTAWATFSMQLAGFAVLALLIYIAVLVSRVSEVTNFYQIGHLDPWLRVEVALAVIVFLTLIFAFLSSLRMLRRPLRWITKVEVHHRDAVLPLPRMVPAVLPPHPRTRVGFSYAALAHLLPSSSSPPAITFVAVASVAIPLYVIRPFVPEDPHALAFALSVRPFASWIALFCVIILMLLAASTWSRTRRAVHVGFVAAILIAAISLVAAHVDIFERMFHPNPAPTFAPASQAAADLATCSSQ